MAEVKGREYESAEKETIRFGEFFLLLKRRWECISAKLDNGRKLFRHDPRIVLFGLLIMDMKSNLIKNCTCKINFFIYN